MKALIMDQITENKTYIGDGVYASFEGDALRLETLGLGFGNDIIYLEPEVFSRLLEYAKQVGWKALI